MMHKIVLDSGERKSFTNRINWCGKKSMNYDSCLVKMRPFRFVCFKMKAIFIFNSIHLTRVYCHTSCDTNVNRRHWNAENNTFNINELSEMNKQATWRRCHKIAPKKEIE